MNSAHWGHRLSSSLKTKGWTMRRASRAANVSVSTLSDWISYGRAPRDLTPIKRLSEQLGVSFCWLLTGEHEKASFEQVFTHGESWEGFAEIRIRRLVKR